MLRNTVLFLVPAALCVVVANMTESRWISAGFLILVAIAVALAIATLAEVVFHRRGSRFWCSWAFAGGTLGAVLCLLNLALFRKDGVDPLLWIVAGGTLICFLFPLRHRSFQMIRGIFVPIALANGALLAWLCLLMVANIPWFYPAPNLVSESVPERTPRQVEDMEALLKLIPRGGGMETKGEINEDSLAETAKTVLDKLNGDMTPTAVRGMDLTPIAEDLAKVEPELDRIWNFLAEHQPVGTLKLEPPHVSFLTLRSATQLESLAIQLDAQQGKDFRPRLRRFFRGAKTVDELNTGIVSAMIGGAVILMSADTLIPLADHLVQPDPELLELLQTNRNAIMPAFREALLAEGIYRRDALNCMDWKLDATENFLRLIAYEAFEQDSLENMAHILDARFRHWPFYNERDTLRIVEENLRADLAAFEEPDSQSRLVLFKKREEDALRSAEGSYGIINPCGRKIALWFNYDWTRAYLRTTIVNARLAALELLLRNKWGQSSTPIVNPLTGKPFEIAPDGSIRLSDGLSKEMAWEFQQVYPKAEEPISL